MADEIGVVATSDKFNKRMDADVEQIQQLQQRISERMNGRIQTYADSLDIELGSGPQQWRYDDGPVRRFVRNDVREKVAKEDAEKMKEDADKMKDRLGRKNEIKPPTKRRLKNGEGDPKAASEATPTPAGELVPIGNRATRRRTQKHGKPTGA